MRRIIEEVREKVSIIDKDTLRVYDYRIKWIHELTEVVMMKLQNALDLFGSVEAEVAARTEVIICWKLYVVAIVCIYPTGFVSESDLCIFLVLL